MSIEGRRPTRTGSPQGNSVELRGQVGGATAVNVFRADPVVSCLRRARGPSSLPDGCGRKEVPMKRFEVYEILAWGDVDQATVTPALALLDSILGILWRLTHP